jgi:putative ABC transport system permease protein
MRLRASGRTREIAVRRALGATYGDVVRQLLIEAVLLAGVGGALGFGVSVALLRVLPRIAPPNVPRLDEIRLGGASVIGAIAVSCVTVIICGLLPVVVAARSSNATSLRLDSRSGSETRRRRMIRQTLVAAQVGLAMIMLGGAALLTRSLARLEGQNLGYQSNHLSVVQFTWNLETTNSAKKLRDLAQRLQTRIAAIPGVRSSTPLVIPPLLGESAWQVRLLSDGQSDADSASNAAVPADVIGPEFFTTFGIQLRRGRAFTIADNSGSAAVMIVNESFARRYWPNDPNPIGKQLRLVSAIAPSYAGGTALPTTVGVVADTRLRNVREVTPMAYFPVGQRFWQGTFALRSANSLSMLLPALRAAC